MFKRTAYVLALAALIASTSGCGWLRGHRGADYTSSQAGRPLEVPPDLDSPSTAAALTVPAGGNGASASAPSDSPVESTAAPEGATAAASPSTIIAGEDSTLSMTDSVAGAYRRVGLALSRAGVGEVVSSDEASSSYTLRGVTQVASRAEGGFFKRMFKGGSQTSAAEATRVVKIVADGAGSQVRIEDENGEASSDEFARRIISALKERLG